MRENKRLLVTGASSDFGTALIKEIGTDYEKIYAHYNHENEAFTGLCENLKDRIIPIRADFSDVGSLDGMIDQIVSDGGADHFVHLAAPGLKPLQFRKTDWDAFEDPLRISLRSAVKLSGALLPGMAKNSYGKIIFMLSSVTLNLPPKYEAAYTVSKYALLGLMKSLSAEYAEKGITVNGVSPDLTETKFLKEFPKLIIQKNAEESPLKRNLTVNDVIPAFRYLLSDGADAVAGLNLSVTGGVQ
ncbi:MAG: SDR family oxidoreductase [Lachnospiraceae bacterium]|nr:SDR family oxidoreductase [Lachnospiraceae bacterium]